MSNQQHDPDPPTASTAPVGYREAVALLRACSTEHGLVEAINRANAMPMDGEPWSFAEYIHGKELKPRGRSAKAGLQPPPSWRSVRSRGEPFFASMIPQRNANGWLFSLAAASTALIHS